MNKYSSHIIYVRFSHRKQKHVLHYQIQYLQTQFFDYRIGSDVGLGRNDRQKGFTSILTNIFKCKTRLNLRTVKLYCETNNE